MTLQCVILLIYVLTLDWAYIIRMQRIRSVALRQQRQASSALSPSPSPDMDTNRGAYSHAPSRPSRQNAGTMSIGKGDFGYDDGRNEDDVEASIDLLSRDELVDARVGSRAVGGLGLESTYHLALAKTYIPKIQSLYTSYIYNPLTRGADRSGGADADASADARFATSRQTADDRQGSHLRGTRPGGEEGQEEAHTATRRGGKGTRRRSRGHAARPGHETMSIEEVEIELEFDIDEGRLDERDVQGMEVRILEYLNMRVDDADDADYDDRNAVAGGGGGGVAAGSSRGAQTARALKP
jgi:hypothetical protein